MRMLKQSTSKLLLISSLCAFTNAALAGYEIKITDQDTITFGGYIKVNARYVDGDVAYQDFWTGTGTALAKSNSQFRINANETRFNTKYVHGDVMGYIELDFLGGGGNQIISNSANPRLRHAYIKYQNILAGQTWTTFMNTSALPETSDYAGATVGIAFSRQGQLRYTMGNFQFSIENPETWGGDTTNDDIPDVIAKYTFKGDWGNVSISGLGRSLTTLTGNSETTFGASIAGRLKTIGKDDLRFQFHKGELGRYVSGGAAKGLYNDKVEDMTSYLVAYRHYWTDTLRSTLLYGEVEADLSGAERSQWGINLFQNLTSKLAVGAEVGQFSMDEQSVDSNYGQITLKYTL